MSRSDRDLDVLADELSGLLWELRAELRRPPRGPMGLPRPPTPRELLSFTERRTIPATIAVLEANIRALELLADAIRMVERSDSAADRAAGMDTRDRTRSRATATGRSALGRLETTLDDLQDALEGEPAGPETRRLLEEARALREEIDERLREAADRSRRGAPPGTRSRTDPSTAGGHEIPVDVEDELESIRRDLEEENPDKR